MSLQKQQNITLRSLGVKAALPVRLLRLIVVFVLTLLSASVAAHEIKPAIVDLNYVVNKSADNQLVVQMIVNLESLMADIGPDHEDTDESENSARYEQLRALDKDALLQEFSEFQSQFLSGLNITNTQNAKLNLRIQAIDIPPVGSTEIPRDTKITLQSTLAADTLAIRWQWSEAFGEVIVRANSDAQAMDYAALLAPGQPTELIDFTQKTTQSVASVVINYIKLGFVHILPKGLDHILFVIGLFLLSATWRPLLLQVTAFTIAHSITLALGATNTLSVSSGIVEPLIALSIVFVCVENLFASKLGKWRLTMVFIFGLLHGLGFASVLEEVGLSSSSFVVALLGFNVGVELGQLTVIVVCMLLVGFWFGKKSWYQGYITKPASVVIGLVGVFWFVQRTML